MKANKYFSGLFCSALISFAVGCSEDAYVPGEPENENSLGLYFGESGMEYIVGASSESTIEIPVFRTKSEEKVTVPLTLSVSADGIFSAPESITFEDGQTEQVIVVSLTMENIEFWKNYTCSVDLPHDSQYTFIYGDKPTSFKIEMTKEDYAPYASGVYNSSFFEQAWPQVLEYSPSLKKYRFSDLWTEGYDLTFQWDGEQKVAVDWSTLATGYVYGDYGMIYVASGMITYDKETKTFTFPWQWLFTMDGSTYQFTGVPADTYVMSETAKTEL